MDPQTIRTALAAIRRERDVNRKHQRLASLCTALFREHGIELVVVGGSAIEFYTDGAYTSGDLDLCILKPAGGIPLRLRQELLARLGARGGPRSWEVAGLFVDLLGPVESDATTPFRTLLGPYGAVQLMKPEDLIVERVLVGVYPQPNPEAQACARKLLAVALTGQVAVDWAEVRRLAKSPAYRIFPECAALVRELCDELQTPNPLHPAR